jgi:hypothetical protein
VCGSESGWAIYLQTLHRLDQQHDTPLELQIGVILEMNLSLFTFLKIPTPHLHSPFAFKLKHFSKSTLFLPTSDFTANNKINTFYNTSVVSKATFV